MATPPFDRAVALACTLASVRRRWLYVRCRCGHSSPHPLRLMLESRPDLASRTVADALVRLRCSGCGERDITVHLCEDAHGPGPITGSLEPGWALLLHGGGVPEERSNSSRG